MQKVALVTGSSRGIGAAAALALAKAGCDVAINYVHSAKAAQILVETIQGIGRRALAIRADVAHWDQVQALVQRAVDALGGLHILVNNAGHSSHGTLEALSPNEWRRMLAVTLDASFFCAKAAVPHFKAAGWGRIVNVSSLRAMTGSDHGSHYASAKAGLIGFTKSLALELAPSVTVNAIAPGYTATDMNRKALETKGDAIRAMIPLKKEAQPEQIASVIAFLCSEGADYITGETINVNGGIYVR